MNLLETGTVIVGKVEHKFLVLWNSVQSVILVRCEFFAIYSFKMGSGTVNCALLVSRLCVNFVGGVVIGDEAIEEFFSESITIVILMLHAFQSASSRRFELLGWIGGE